MRYKEKYIVNMCEKKQILLFDIYKKKTKKNKKKIFFSTFLFRNVHTPLLRSPAFLPLHKVTCEWYILLYNTTLSFYYHFIHFRKHRLYIYIDHVKKIFLFWAFFGSSYQNSHLFVGEVDGGKIGRFEECLGLINSLICNANIILLYLSTSLLLIIIWR